MSPAPDNGIVRRRLASRTRNRITAAGLAAAVAAIVGFSAAAAPSVPAGQLDIGKQSKVLFEDHFNTASPAWTFFNREVRAVRGHLAVDGDYTANADARDGWALTHVGDDTWRDYAVRTTYATTNRNGYPRDTHMLKLYFRVQDRTGHQGHFYELEVVDPGQTDPGSEPPCPGANLPEGRVDLFRWGARGRTQVGTECASNTVVGTNEVIVKARGGNFTVIANGQVILTATDPNPFEYGGVGVGAVWETDAWFDNVLVTTLR